MDDDIVRSKVLIGTTTTVSCTYDGHSSALRVFSWLAEFFNQ